MLDKPPIESTPEEDYDPTAYNLHNAQGRCKAWPANNLYAETFPEYSFEDRSNCCDTQQISQDPTPTRKQNHLPAIGLAKVNIPSHGHFRGLRNTIHCLTGQEEEG